METHERYLPAGVEEIGFEFVSTSQGLDSSNIAETEECDMDKHRSLIETNVIDLLTLAGTKSFEFKIIKEGEELIPDQESLNRVQENINENDMIKTTGEERTINLQASIQNEEVWLSENRGEDETVVTPNAASQVEALNDGMVDAEDKEKTWWQRFSQGVQTADEFAGYVSSMNLLDEASASLASAGFTADSEALSKASTSICKMMGVKNYIEMDDYAKAIMALCGIARINGIEEAEKICSLAGLYQAIQSGNIDAVLAVLRNILNQGGFDVYINAEQLRAAIESGDIEDVLMAASAALRAVGADAAAHYLGSMAALIYGIENEDYLATAAIIFNMVGEEEMANFLLSLRGLQQAIESGDAEAILGELSRVAKSLGYSGIADIQGIVSTISGIVDMALNMDDLLAACEGKIPWDMICITPPVGGGVCHENFPGDPSCSFSYGLPSFEIDKICNDLVFDMGFQIDCTCVYSCPEFPQTRFWTRSVGVNVKEILAMMDPSMLLEMLGIPELSAILNGDLSTYCKFDP
jgi:hypothetical protein